MMEKAIEVENLNYSYPDKTPALKNINFSVSRGEVCAIIGPNGAGKSTLLLHLNGILRGEGRVKIQGEEISRKNLKKIRSKVGMVFQDPNDQLFMPHVFDDIAFGPLNMGLERAEVGRRVNSILRRLALVGSENKPSYRMSLGEMKKISLATVLVLEPEILVLDEPVSGLDPGARRTFIGILKNTKATKVIGTHDLDLAFELCSKVVLLDRGMVIARGHALEILKNKELLEAHSLEVPLSLCFSPQGECI
ncbi:MAG: energy-coupling factor ABC transporter ATP-binding protein [Candidatus Aminicenantales bacterium]